MHKERKILVRPNSLPEEVSTARTFPNLVPFSERRSVPIYFPRVAPVGRYTLPGVFQNGVPHKRGVYASSSAEGRLEGEDAQHMVDDRAPFGGQPLGRSPLVGPDGGRNILNANRGDSPSLCELPWEGAVLCVSH